MTLFSRFQPSRKRDATLTALFFLGVLSILYYPAAWWLWVPYDGDMWTQYFPAKWYTFSYIKQGVFPLWTPNLLFGFPIFAEAQTGILYPFSIIFYLFSTTSAFTISILIRVLLGGIFMYLYVRRITDHVWGAALSGLTFACSGYMTAQLRHENVGNALIWLPLILLLLDNWITQNNRRHLAAGALCLGVSFLAGYFYISFFILIVSSAYYIFLSYLKHKNSITDMTALRPLGIGFLLFGLIGVGLAAVQILPNYELAQESIRSGGLGYEVSTQVSYPPFQLISLIFPKFFGYPVELNIWGMWRGNYIDLVAYLGIIPLLTLMAAVMIRRDRYTLFFALTFGIALLLAFGQFSPLWYLVNKLPVFSMMRNPARFLSVVTFSGAVLAGLGLASLMTGVDMEKISRFRRVYLTGTGVILVAGLIGGWVVSGAQSGIIGMGRWFIDEYVYRRSIHEQTKAHYYTLLDQFYDQLKEVAAITHPYIYVPILFVAGSALLIWFLTHRKGHPVVLGVMTLLLAGADLTYFGHRYNVFLPPEAYDQKKYYTEVMETDTDLFRYCFAPLWISLRNYDALRFDQMYIQGHSPIRLKRQEDIIETLRPLMQDLPNAASVPLMNMLNIKYIVTGDSLKQDWIETRFDEGAKVYENLTVMPRAFLTPRARVLPTEGEVLAALADPDYSPGEEVLFEDTPDLPELLYEGTAAGETSIIRYDLHDIVVEVTSEGGYLVLTDMFFPGWYADIDGEDQPILRANHAFRAVQVPPGTHRVRFRYEPLSFTIGAGLSLLALAAAIGMMVFRSKASS